MKKLFIKNPFKRLQKGSVAALCIFSAVMLILAGSNNSCVHEKLHEQEPIIPCDPKLPFHPWAYDFVKEQLENGFHGRFYQCTYKDGRGFLIESHEKADTIYSLWTCEGKVVYEREDKPIQKIYPEMNVKIDRRFCSVYPMWEEEDTDGFECENVNPYTLPLIKKYLDELLSSYMTGCRTGIRISQFIYRDSKGIFSEGIGFRFSKISSWSRTEVYVNCLNEHLFSFAYGANENFYNMEHSEHINIEKYKIIFTLD